MKKLSLLLAAVIIAGLYACVQTEMQMPVKPEAPMDAPVSMNIYRNSDELNIEVAVPEREWGYTSVLSDDGTRYTLVVKDIQRRLGDMDIIRPILHYEKTEYPSGFRLIFTLASRHRLDTVRNELGLHIKLTAIEPDMEMLSMKTFGAWSDPVNPAKTFLSSVNEGDMTRISFDSQPIYAEGEAGGRYFIDIFGVNILAGTVKHKGLMTVNSLPGKSRLIFKNKVQVCPGDKELILGKSCGGYSGLSGFVREKNDRSESFQFMLPGRPDMKEMDMKGLAAFGFKDTRLFSQVFQRYSGGDVYKVEAREKDGLLWLIFLYSGELKYRKYYSGDKFFVVFYR